MSSANQIKPSALRTDILKDKAVGSLQNSINQYFIDVAEINYPSKGRVILTGIGKSALIAAKIMATFNSTGTSPVFLHAADAIYGDPGIVADGNLRRALQAHENIGGRKTQDIMNQNPRCIDEESLVVDALTLMKENNITPLPVLRKKKFVGVIHLHDILKEGII